MRLLSSIRAILNWAAGKSWERHCIGARKQPKCVWWPRPLVCDRENTQSLQNELISQEMDTQINMLLSVPESEIITTTPLVRYINKLTTTLMAHK